VTEKIFEWLFALMLVAVLLPCIVIIVVDTLGPILLMVSIVAIVAGAYRHHERSRPRSPKGGSGTERTPILPREDQ
jgi:hypothetical protein